MYKGNNKTALSSQRKIQESFLRLLDEMDYTDITIKNICITAGISRQTFYYLFESKEEIVYYYLNGFFSDLEIFLNNNNIISMRDLIYNYFLAIDENIYVKKIMQVSSVMPIFTEILLNYMDKIHVMKTSKRAGKNDYYANMFLSSGMNGIFFYWLENSKDISLNKLVDIVENILEGNVFE